MQGLVISFLLCQWWLITNCPSCAAVGIKLVMGGGSTMGLWSREARFIIECSRFLTGCELKGLTMGASSHNLNNEFDERYCVMVYCFGGARNLYN